MRSRVGSDRVAISQYEPMGKIAKATDFNSLALTLYARPGLTLNWTKLLLTNSCAETLAVGVLMISCSHQRVGLVSLKAIR